MGLRLRRAVSRLRVLYGATKPLPRPPGRYHVVPTEEEQLRDFEAAERRRLDRDSYLARASHAAMKKVFRRD